MDRMTPSAKTLAEAAAAGPSLADLPLSQARAAVVAMAAQFGAGDEVATVEDIALSAPQGDLALRVYRPHTMQRLPALLWLHGGGWCTGNLDTSDALCRRLAARIGTVVAALDYRLAPENPFPAALEDVDIAARWLADPANGMTHEQGICIGGDSAGGNLAAAYAMNDPAVRIAAQLLAFPPVDSRGGYPSEVEFREGFFTTLDEFRTWIGHYLAGHEAADPYASPLLAVGSGSPPALVLTAECDILRDSAEEFVDQLRQQGVLVRSHRFTGMVHDFILFGDLLPESEPATDLIAREFGELLREAVGPPDRAGRKTQSSAGR